MVGGCILESRKRGADYKKYENLSKYLQNPLRYAVRTFENYEAYGKYHFMENMQKQNRQKKKGHVFVDCKNDRNRQVWRLLQRADTVVINFPQEYPVLLNYFQNHPRISGNIFYLISNSPSDPMDNEKYTAECFV